MNLLTSFCVFVIILINTQYSWTAHVTPLSKNKIPGYLKPCRKSDPNLAECLRSSIEIIRSNLSAGIPELLVPPCEPLSIPEIRIKQNAGAIRMESEYTNIVVSGLSNFTLRNIRIDPVTNKFRIDLWFPMLQMAADYHLHGKLLLMPLSGDGKCTGNFTDVDATVIMKHGTVLKNGINHLSVDDVNVEFNIGDASVKLNNLFNGDEELGAMMNRFLNENWREITAEVRPALAESIEHILRGIASKLYDMYSLEQILPE